MKRHRLSLISSACLALIAVAVMLIAASCGSSSSTSASTTPSASTPSTAASGPAALLPDSVKQAGVLKFGTNLPGVPFEFFMADNKTMTGADIDLGNGLAKILGLKPEWANINWDGLIPALTTSRFDAVISEMGDFTDRQAQVSFVDYLKGGNTLLLRAADKGKFTKIDDLAGLTLGATKGAATVGVGNKVIAQLKADGKKPITLEQFPGEGPGTLALQSGRISGYIYDWVSGVYRARTQPLFAVAFPNLMNATFLYGIAVRKDADGQKLADALQAALNQMIADGSYKAIMDKYGMSDFLLQQATINGGTTSSGG